MFLCKSSTLLSYSPRFGFLFTYLLLHSCKTLKRESFFLCVSGTQYFTSISGGSAGILEEVESERGLCGVKFRHAERGELVLQAVEMQ